MKKVINNLDAFINPVEVIGDENSLDTSITEQVEYNASLLFSKGLMPDGSKWPAERRKIFAGFDGDISIRKLKKTKGKKGDKFSFELVLKPGRGGGGGAGIDAATSNHWFNLAGTDKAPVNDMKKAFKGASNKAKSQLGASAYKWLSDKENWWWRIVGWEDRKNWSKPKAMISSIEVGNPMVDVTRRKWPSGRTEIWAPLVIKITADAKQKITEDVENDTLEEGNTDDNKDLRKAIDLLKSSDTKIKEAIMALGDAEDAVYPLEGGTVLANAIKEKAGKLYDFQIKSQKKLVAEVKSLRKKNTRRDKN